MSISGPGHDTGATETDSRWGSAVLETLDSGYEIVEEPSEEYHELGAQRIFENDDCRIDVFNRLVVDELVLSEEMRERSATYLEARNLTVALLSAEGVFLFESVAGAPTNRAPY